MHIKTRLMQDLLRHSTRVNSWQLKIADEVAWRDPTPSRHLLTRKKQCNSFQKLDFQVYISLINFNTLAVKLPILVLNWAKNSKNLKVFLTMSEERVTNCAIKNLNCSKESKSFSTGLKSLVGNNTKQKLKRWTKWQWGYKIASMLWKTQWFTTSCSWTSTKKSGSM